LHGDLAGRTSKSIFWTRAKAVVEINDAEKMIRRNHAFGGQCEKIQIRAIERVDLRDKDQQSNKALRQITYGTEAKDYDSDLSERTDQLAETVRRSEDDNRITEARLAVEQGETGSVRIF
jgi:hypothetical protein